MNRNRLPTDQHVFDQASEVRVRLIVEHLRKALDQFFEERSLGFADGLMGVHNFHKLIVCDIVSRLTGEHEDHQGEGEGLSDREKNQIAAVTYQVARDTWVNAMDELIERRAGTYRKE